MEKIAVSTIARFMLTKTGSIDWLSLPGAGTVNAIGSAIGTGAKVVDKAYNATRKNVGGFLNSATTSKPMLMQSPIRKNMKVTDFLRGPMSRQ